jgi:hypothetical protein
MSLTVVFRQTALRNLARIRSEDKDLFGRIRRAIALSADQPYPKNAVAWGATGVYRLHSGDTGFCTNSMMRQQRYTSSTSGHPLNLGTAQQDGGSSYPSASR